jgi:hypothetical protein
MNNKENRVNHVINLDNHHVAVRNVFSFLKMGKSETQLRGIACKNGPANCDSIFVWFHNMSILTSWTHPDSCSSSRFLFTLKCVRHVYEKRYQFPVRNTK